MKRMRSEQLRNQTAKTIATFLSKKEMRALIHLYTCGTSKKLGVLMTGVIKPASMKTIREMRQEMIALISSLPPAESIH